MNEEVKPLKQCSPRRRFARYVARTILGVVAIAVLSAGTLALKLSQGPIDGARIIPVLEKIMGNPERLRFDIGSLTLSWRGRSDPIALQMENVRLLGPQGEFMGIKHIEIGISISRLLLAHLHFKYAKVQNLSVKLIRLEDGAVTMTGLENDKEKAQSVALRMDNIVKDLPSIERLTLSDMRVIFEDRKDALIRRFDDVDMEVVQDRGFGKRSLGGYVTTALTGINDGSQATIDFIFDGEEKKLSSSIRIDNADTRKLIGGVLRAGGLPMIDMMVQGRAEIALSNDFRLEFLKLKLKGDDGMLLWPRNYGEGLENQKLTNFDINIGFDPKTQTIQMDNAEITVKGITLKISGTLSAQKGWDKLKGDLRAAIPVVAVDALPAVWPKVWDSGARHWLVDRMDKGRIANLRVDVPFEATRHKIAPPATEPDEEPAYKWDIMNGTIKGTFDFTGVTVDYRAPMLPISDTTGKGLYEGLSLTLDINQAKAGKLKISKGRLYFDDLITAGTGKADLDLTLNGPIADVFKFLEKEPISYRRKVDIDGTKAKGTADVVVFSTFPTTKDMRVEDVKVKATAKLYDLSMPNAVKGMTLAGKEFNLEASENHFKIDGSGTIEGRPATLTWHELFSATPADAFSAKLEADISTDKSIRQRFIGPLETRVEGIIPATISMLTKPDGVSTLSVDANITDAAIDLRNPFNTVKQKGVQASAIVTGSLDKGYIQSLDTLSIKGEGIALESGKIDFTRDSNNEPVLAAATLTGLKLGDTQADIIATWKNEHDIKASVTGHSFDARWIMGDKEGDASDKKPTAFNVVIKTNKLFVSDLPLESVNAAFVGNPDGSMATARLDATAAGATVKLRYGMDSMLLESPNAGAALAALGITERVRNGNIKVEGTPIEGGAPGDMKGLLVIENFSVVKAPMLAKLVNLLSLPGLLNILAQDTGLKFARAESEIFWLNRAGGPVIQFKDGRTSGSSLGLTFEGEASTANDTIAIQGTAIPMSEINGLISSIPLIGDILTGGDKGSGIFAATYTMKGQGSNPEVSVNPLSVLTPGILRRILFENGDPTAEKTKDLTKKKSGSQ
ncbi:MAG: hypothetical protein EBQ96_08160 [Proteobacteria bacterium]|nr:hypothetical protein [Pseudomonadota bacterium]